jgi:hypothetical protein
MIVILDPGVKAKDGDNAYEEGKRRDIFIKIMDNGKLRDFVGRVWPGKVWWRKSLKIHGIPVTNLNGCRHASRTGFILMSKTTGRNNSSSGVCNFLSMDYGLVCYCQSDSAGNINFESICIVTYFF